MRRRLPAVVDIAVACLITLIDVTARGVFAAIDGLRTPPTRTSLLERSIGRPLPSVPALLAALDRVEPAIESVIAQQLTRDLALCDHCGQRRSVHLTDALLCPPGTRSGRTYTVEASPLPIHRTQATYPRESCSTCDGGGCPDCTDPA